MRILLVNKFWRPVGGVEEHAFTLKRAFEERGHEVVPFAMADPENLDSPYSKYFVSPVEFRGGAVLDRARSVGRAVVGLDTLRKLDRLLDEVPIDAVHVLHAYHQMGMTCLPLLKRRKIPTLLSLHDYKVACPSYRFFSDVTGKVCTICLDQKGAFAWAPAKERCWDGSAAGGVMLSLEAASTRITRAYQAPDVVLVLNELLRRSCLHAGVDPEKIRLIPHFVEPGDPADRRPGRHVLYVGRLVPEKGVDVLIDAVAAAGVALRVLGDGRDRGALEARAASIGADVTFLGQQPKSVVLDELMTAAAMVVPSTWHEVSPLVIYEAMGVGLPVIGTELGGIPDLIGDGRGFLVPPNDVDALTAVLRRLDADPAVGSAAALAALTYARAELTKDRWIARLVDAYAAMGTTL